MSSDSENEDVLDQTVYITVHRRKDDSRDCSWHDAVTKLVREKFGGIRNLWNYAWIEYTVLKSRADDLIAELAKQGYKAVSENN